MAATARPPVNEGMKIHTNTKKVREARRTVVELLLSEHEGSCQSCDRSEDCELQDIGRALGIRELQVRGSKGPPYRGRIDPCSGS
jgi:NADH dehydrogenase/NADH:ubiquinone oxidoreductase subunit G